MKIKAKELNATHIGMIYSHPDPEAGQYNFRIDKITIHNGYLDIEGENIHKGFRDAAGPAFETEIFLRDPAEIPVDVEINKKELKMILNWYSYFSGYISDDENEKLVKKLESLE